MTIFLPLGIPMSRPPDADPEFVHLEVGDHLLGLPAGAVLCDNTPEMEQAGVLYHGPEEPQHGGEHQD